MLHRQLGIAFGVLTHLLFIVTVAYLFQFLSGPAAPVAKSGNLAIDLLLAVQFAAPHSVLLHPTIRERLGAIIGPAFYGCFFCCVTCGSLLLTIAAWQSSPIVFWQLTSARCTAVQAAFLASWAALLYSLHLNGLGYQTGFTPWWNWVRRRPAKPRLFRPRGAYHWLRHPVYLSFLGLLWFVPLMTLDRALLTLSWTAYIFMGSWLKDRRLEYYLGDTYREYQARVPGYLGMPFGPLARIAWRLPESLERAPVCAKSGNPTPEIDPPTVPFAATLGDPAAQPRAA